MPLTTSGLVAECSKTSGVGRLGLVGQTIRPVRDLEVGGSTTLWLKPTSGDGNVRAGNTLGGLVRFDDLATVRSLAGLGAKACAQSNHDACGGQLSCEAVADDLDLEWNTEVAAARYDVRVVTGSWLHTMPTDEWPTAALLRSTSDLILSLPWENPRWRSVSITSGLARLAERGIPADMVIRTCVGPALLRQALFVASSVWCESDPPERGRVPHQLRGWLQLIEDCGCGIDCLRSPSEVFTAVINDPSWRRAEEALHHGAVAHVIDWQIADYLKVDIPPEDTILTGGLEPTQWVYDRFTKTTTGEWRTSSLQWEIVFGDDPQRVAETAGLSLELLAERPSSHRMASRSLTRRLLRQRGHQPPAEELAATQLVESLVGLLQRGLFNQARELAWRTYRMAPGEFEVANAAAFCVLPFDPREAAGIFAKLKPRTPEERLLLELNRSTARLAAGDLMGVRSSLGELQTDNDDASFFLWRPEGLTKAQPQIAHMSVGEWVADVKRLAGSEQPLQVLHHHQNL